MRGYAVLVAGMIGCALSGGAARAQTTDFPLPDNAAPSAPAVVPTPEAPKPASTTASAPTPATTVSPAPAPSAIASPVPSLVTPAPAAAQPKAAAAAPIKKKPAPPPPQLETALPNDPTPTYQQDTLIATTQAAARYDDIVKTGGWPTDLVALNAHSIGPDVAKLRKRLAIEGDLSADEQAEGPAAQVWDKRLSDAVKHFQTRMGLRGSGVVSGQTLKELNVPASERAHALAASIERMSAFSFSFGERYVVVNLPSTSVEAIENRQVVHRYVAIVGDPDHASPEIAAHITQVTLNPTWTVPVSIIKKEIIPRMQRDPGYLARQKIRILDGSGNEVDAKSIDWSTNRAANYTLRQDSGRRQFARLHPHQHAEQGSGLYARHAGQKAVRRGLPVPEPRLRTGAGRVRLRRMAARRLAPPDGGVWDKAAMEAKVKEGGKLDIKVEKPTPVIWVYLTGWANDDGLVHFRDDVYGLDNPAIAKAPPAEATAR